MRLMPLHHDIVLATSVTTNCTERYGCQTPVKFFMKPAESVKLSTVLQVTHTATGQYASSVVYEYGNHIPNHMFCGSHVPWVKA